MCSKSVGNHFYWGLRALVCFDHAVDAPWLITTNILHAYRAVVFVRGRYTPVVQDLELLPDPWERPRVDYVPHPHYECGNKQSQAIGVVTDAQQAEKKCGTKRSTSASVVEEHVQSLPKVQRREKGTSTVAEQLVFLCILLTDNQLASVNYLIYSHTLLFIIF